MALHSAQGYMLPSGTDDAAQHILRLSCTYKRAASLSSRAPFPSFPSQHLTPTSSLSIISSIVVTVQHGQDSPTSRRTLSTCSLLCCPGLPSSHVIVSLGHLPCLLTQSRCSCTLTDTQAPHLQLLPTPSVQSIKRHAHDFGIISSTPTPPAHTSAVKHSRAQSSTLKHLLKLKLRPSHSSTFSSHSTLFALMHPRRSQAYSSTALTSFAHSKTSALCYRAIHA